VSTEPIKQHSMIESNNVFETCSKK